MTTATTSTTKTTPLTQLSDRVATALAASPFITSRAVQVETDQGNVVLKGRVESFFEKQMAQETLRRIDGVQQINNLLEVSWT